MESLQIDVLELIFFLLQKKKLHRVNGINSETCQLARKKVFFFLNIKEKSVHKFYIMN